MPPQDLMDEALRKAFEAGRKVGYEQAKRETGKELRKARIIGNGIKNGVGTAFDQTINSITDQYEDEITKLENERDEFQAQCNRLEIENQWLRMWLVLIPPHERFALPVPQGYTRVALFSILQKSEKEIEGHFSGDFLFPAPFDQADHEIGAGLAYLIARVPLESEIGPIDSWRPLKILDDEILSVIWESAWKPGENDANHKKRQTQIVDKYYQTARQRGYDGKKRQFKTAL